MCTVGVVLSLTLNTLAQDAKTPETMKPVVITGSMIPTVDAANSVAPVLVLDAKAIEKSGAATVAEVLLKIPQNNAGSFNDGFLSGNSFSKGSSSVSLRGLGPNATLVLLNGRRLAGYGFAQNITDTFVDLNSIPLAAVERIDVLKDGASAIYGSDAIAGVINVILKKEFTGVEFSTRLGNTTNKDALEQLYTGTWGVMTDKGSAMIIADYYSRNGLFLRDRSYSKSADQRAHGGVDARSSAGNPGSILLLDNYVVGEGEGAVVYEPNWYKVPTNPEIAGHPSALEVLAATGLNRYDFNPWISAIGETKRYGVFSTLTYNLTDNLEAFVEASFRHITYRVDAAPTPVFGDTDGFTVAADNPYNPFGQEVSFRYRLTEAGARINLGDTDATRILPGLRLKLGEDWNIETALLWSESRTMEIGKNFISATALQNALNSTDPATALNLFGAGEGVNSQEVIDGLKVNTTRYGVSSLLSPDLKLTGSLPIDWGAGKVGLAVGGEYRQEKISDTADTFSEQNLIVSSGGTSGEGSREAWAAYGELAIPVIGKDLAFTGCKQFDIQVAGRFEDYSDFGNTFKPKVGARWKVVDQVVLRGTYAEGFRAPSLVELFQGQSVSYDPLTDPARGDNDMQYKVVRGGNPDLDAEESKSWTAGFEVEPIKHLTLAVDWFNIEQTAKITDIDPQDILNNEALFPGAVIRNPQTADDIAHDIPGSIVQINSGYKNLATREVEGLDFGVRYTIPTDSWGEFTAQADAAWLYKFDEQPKPGDPYIHYAGSYSQPEWRGSASLDWDYKDLSLTFTANYVGEYDQVNYIVYQYVSDIWTYDLQASYSFRDLQNSNLKWLNDTKVIVGVQNLLDEKPPFSDYSGDNGGYDTAWGDPRGRFVYLQVTKKF
jgi:iron complex outermembrane recepter protein